MHWQYIHISIFTKQYIWENEVLPLLTEKTQVIPYYAADDACRVVGWVVRTIGDK